MSNARRAVFLDRDGTINEEVDYLSSPEQLRLLDRAAEAIRLINLRGWRAIVITNQSGIARGLFDETRLEQIHLRLAQVLAEADARLDAIYFCPHHPEAGEGELRKTCHCRKPQPGMLYKAAKDFDLDLSASVVIGDRLLDVETAHRAGARGVLVLTGYGRREFESTDSGGASRQAVPDYVAEDLVAAVEWVMSNVENE